MDTPSRNKVLFVDDDVFFLELYSRKGKQYNLDVKIANGAVEAFKRLDEGFVPDLFLVDLDMPNINGFEFIKELKNRKLLDHAYVMILTNKNERHDIERAQEYGVDKYIIKATRVPSEVMEEAIDILKSEKKQAA